MELNGSIVLYKEKGMSSSTAARVVKGITGAEKAGHTGTLDPMACGVLVVCLGKHTRLVDYLIQDEKEYNATMYLGIETDTFDLEGEITHISDTEAIQNSSIINAVSGFKGVYMQIPPVYSAIKHKGRKLYEYARKGQNVEIEPRQGIYPF